MEDLKEKLAKLESDYKTCDSKRKDLTLQINNLQKLINDLTAEMLKIEGAHAALTELVEPEKEKE